MVNSISNSIDDSNLLIFNPQTAKIIFSVGQGVFSKATKLMSSLTQALILFADKVVNQEINYIRFQNHRMVFLHTNGLFAIKMVPKDHLPKDYLPAMRIVVGIVSGALKSSTKLQTLNNTISDLYTIIKSPEKVLLVFSKTIEGYKACLVYLAGMKFDLSINLEKISENIVFLKPEKPKELILDDKTGLLSFTNDVDLKNVDINEKVMVNLITDFPFNNQDLNSIKSVQNMFGLDSNATKTGDIILNEENLDEIIGMIVKVDSASGIDFAIQAINNYNKDQKVGKTLYQLVDTKLKSIEERTESTTEQEEISPQIEQKSTQSEPEPITAKLIPENTEIKKKDLSVHDEAITSSLPSSFVNAKPTIDEPSSEKKSLSSSLGNFSSLASEFTDKMKEFYETDVEEKAVQINIPSDKKQDFREDELLDFNYDDEIPNLPHGKYQIMMKALNIYVDLKPFVSGNLDFEQINYRPSLHAYTGEDYSICIEIKIHPNRHEDFHKSFTNFIATDAVNIQEKGKGIFIIGTDRENFPNLFRVSLWLLLIDYCYNIQHEVVTPTDFFNLRNGSIFIIPEGVTPERRKHLPSNISEIIEEEKLLKDTTNPVSIVQALDELLLKIHSKLKGGKGKAIGFVPRPGNQELPLIFEFVLTLSELTGIGWSRW